MRLPYVLNMIVFHNSSAEVTTMLPHSQLAKHPMHQNQNPAMNNRFPPHSSHGITPPSWDATAFIQQQQQQQQQQIRQNGLFSPTNKGFSPSSSSELWLLPILFGGKRGQNVGKTKRDSERKKTIFLVPLFHRSHDTFTTATPILGNGSRPLQSEGRTSRV